MHKLNNDNKVFIIVCNVSRSLLCCADEIAIVIMHRAHNINNDTCVLAVITFSSSSTEAAPAQ